LFYRIKEIWSFFLLSALAIFFGSSCGGKPAAAETKKNELKQILQSGLGLQSPI
jgi:hypothetical protein